MKNTNSEPQLAEKDKQRILNQILSKFKGKGEYKPSDYKSFTIMRRQDGRWSIQLTYSWKGKNRIHSESVIAGSMRKAYAIGEILEWGLGNQDLEDEFDEIFNNSINGW